MINPVNASIELLIIHTIYLSAYIVSIVYSSQSQTARKHILMTRHMLPLTPTTRFIVIIVRHSSIRIWINYKIFSQWIQLPLCLFTPNFIPRKNVSTWITSHVCYNIAECDIMHACWTPNIFSIIFFLSTWNIDHTYSISLSAPVILYNKWKKEM